METVLDTVSLQHILRGISLPGMPNGLPKTCLDPHLRKRQLVLVVDNTGALVEEWRSTCGADLVQVLVVHWESQGWLKAVSPGKLPADISRKLRQLGFKGTIDKLVLRIAVGTDHKIVVSDDSDFWCPQQTSERGNTNAPVARLCRDKLGISILLLRMLVDLLMAL